jgi:hypothetical protein
VDPTLRPPSARRWGCRLPSDLPGLVGGYAPGGAAITSVITMASAGGADFSGSRSRRMGAALSAAAKTPTEQAVIALHGIVVVSATSRSNPTRTNLTFHIVSKRFERASLIVTSKFDPGVKSLATTLSPHDRPPRPPRRGQRPAIQLAEGGDTTPVTRS